MVKSLVHFHKLFFCIFKITPIQIWKIYMVGNFATPFLIITCFWTCEKKLFGSSGLFIGMHSSVLLLLGLINLHQLCDFKKACFYF